MQEETIPEVTTKVDSISKETAREEKTITEENTIMEIEPSQRRTIRKVKISEQK